MNQFIVGQRVWHNFEEKERVFKIIEIRGNVALLESDNPAGPRIKDEEYLTNLKPHMKCMNTNLIGRATCDFKISIK